MEITCSSHPHKLVLKPADNPYYCQMCDQIGFGPTYTCNESGCNFFLHKQCGKPDRSLVKYPFSDSGKCFLKFHTEGSRWQKSSCDACGKKIKGYHYRCLCTYPKRNLHPWCLDHKMTLEAADGLTLYLKKAATTNCLHCQTKDLLYKVRGWAYVSSCGTYCYHVSCVREIINQNWKSAFFSGKIDPFQTVKQSFLADMDQMQQQSSTRKPTMKQASVALKIIYTMLTGDPSGLIGAAQ